MQPFVFRFASIVRQKMPTRIINFFFTRRTAGLLCVGSLLVSGLCGLPDSELGNHSPGILALFLQPILRVGKASVQSVGDLLGMIVSRVASGVSSADSPFALQLQRKESRQGSASAARLFAMEKARLSQDFLHPPLGLPEVPFPKDNRPNRSKIELGKRLFFDSRLSEDGTVSCATCHSPEMAFADAQTISPGIAGRRGARNTPTLINVAFQPYQFWDGRVSSLEEQASHPLANPREMGSGSGIVLERLNRIPEYQTAFEEIFSSPATRETLGQALASFERTIFSAASPYDEYRAGRPGSMSALTLEGMRLFNGKAHCHLCHQGYNFSDGLFHNLGVGWKEGKFADPGRFGVTGIAKDMGAFKTPTLRQIAQTGPYMHDGRFPTLEAVVDFYGDGCMPNPHLDPLIQPLPLTIQEKLALVEFLRSLSGTVSSY